jgi:hypothetical protein
MMQAPNPNHKPPSEIVSEALAERPSPQPFIFERFGYWERLPNGDYHFHKLK